MFLSLYLLTVLSCHFISANEECTKGFMEYDLLEQKASQISMINGNAGELSNRRIGNGIVGRQYVMPSYSFSCSGVITGFLLGVDIRIDGSRVQYPGIQLFTAESADSYQLVSGSQRDIVLNADNFSTSGLINYTLSEPLEFNSSHMLGAYQPPRINSRVTLYQSSIIGQDIIRLNPQYNRAVGGHREDSRLLTYPLTSDTNCLRGFISFEDIKQQAKFVTLVGNVEQGVERFYKDIGFNCNGTITKVIVGMEDNAGQSNPPEIRIWRSTSNAYNQSGPSIQLYYDNATQNVSTNYLRWYNLSEPVSVQEGDVLGIYQPTSNEADSIIYHQEYSGPVNYDGNNMPTGFNYYPLVSVEFEVSTSHPFESLLSSINIVTSSSASASNSPNPPGQGASNEALGSATSLVAGVLVSLTVIAIIGSLLVLIAVLTFIKKRKGKLTTNNTAGLLQDSNITNGMANIVYQSGPSNSNISTKDISNPTYGAGEPNAAYEEPVAAHQSLHKLSSRECMELKSDAKSPTAIYEPISNDYTELNSSLNYGLHVPTNVSADSFAEETGIALPIMNQQAQREQMKAALVNGEEGNIYGLLNDTQYASLKEGEAGFFTEEPIYWDPENNTKRIYEQLAQKKYREIARHEIRILDHLGSGQFGTVDKGVWNTPRGSVEVAIKTLKGSATEDEELKFLQEAAINGQFHHPNIVQLCGVVTVGQPVMIILEYITHGDLKSFLEGIRPAPGELANDSLSILLWKFSHQVACGMAYLSHKKFVHRDLAARNVLVSNGTVCKIADFGMSRNLQDEDYYTSHSKQIPVKWTAPEAICYRKYSTQSDVWSYGAVLYEIWSVGHKPFEQYKNQECIKLVESGYRLPAPSGCPRAIYEIMINCWHPVAASRPSFEEIKSMLSQGELLASLHSVSSLGMTDVNTEKSCYPELQNKYQ